MRITLFAITILAFLQGCIAQPSSKKEIYSWLSFESIPRDASGKVNGKPEWTAHSRMPFPYDTFMVSKNHDSISVVYANNPVASIFKTVQIHSSVWKPKPQYGNALYFLGTYETDSLPGMYFSFYTTKDWSSLMQVEYTNPGNLMSAIYFSKDSLNILQKAGVFIDPKDEKSEPEQLMLSPR